MKKFALILTLALMIALPLFGLTETALETEPTSTPAATWGQRRGNRWNQEPVTPKSNFFDGDNDGECDNCGAMQGQNLGTPGFSDENKDGVCDHYGTDSQGQGARNMQTMRGLMQGRRGMRGMNGRGIQGNTQGPAFTDENKDGICDNFGTDTQGQSRMQGGRGCGRNRR